MRIGIATTDFRPMPLAEQFDLIQGMGFTALQVSFDKFTECDYTAEGSIEIPPSIDPAFGQRVRKKAEACGLALSAVNGIFNAAHPDAEIREEGLRRFKMLARITADMGCPLISLSSGTRNLSSTWRGHPDNVTPAAWETMADTMKHLVDIAEEVDITLAIETEAANIIDTPGKSRKLLDEIGSPRLRMIMDCANLFRKGEAHRENVDARIEEAFAAFGGDVALAHGKDILDSEGIDFCATGEGIINFPLFLRLLRERDYQGAMILHGIYDEAKMIPCRAFIEGLLDQ